MIDFAAGIFCVADAFAFGAVRRSDMVGIGGKKNAPRSLAGGARPGDPPGTNSLARRGGRRLGFPTPYSNRLSKETILDGLLSHEPGVVTLVPEPENEPAHAGRLLASLWVRSGLRDVTQIGVRGSRTSIGRDSGNEVVLDSPAVDIRHAQLSLARGIWTLTDLGSANGTWVDRVRVEQSLPLAPGSEVRIADVVLTFAPRDEWSDSPVQPSPAAPAFASPLFQPPEEAIQSPRLVVRAAVILGVCVLAYLLLAVR